MQDQILKNYTTFHKKLYLLNCRDNSKRHGTPACSFEDQVDPAVAREGFDRLLAEVQRIAGEEAKRLEGTEGEALVEAVNAGDAGLVTGRLSNNMLVHFPGDASMIGSYVRVKLTEPHGFYYFGERIEDL